MEARPKSSRHGYRDPARTGYCTSGYDSKHQKATGSQDGRDGPRRWSRAFCQIDDRPLYAQQLPSRPARVESLSKARAQRTVVCFLGLITLVIERAELEIIQKGTCRTSRGDKRMWRVLSIRLIRWRLLARTSVVLVLGSDLDCLSTATTSVIVQL